MINIAFDIDGCIVNMDEHFRSIVSSRYNKEYTPAPNWDLSKSYNISNSVCWDILVEVYMNPGNTPIINGAKEVLYKLYNLNNKEEPLQFITARPKWAASMTYSLLDRIIPDIDYQIAFANHKIKYLKDYPYIIEDSPNNVEYFLSQGKIVFMPVYKYNDHLYPCDNHITGSNNLIRITTIASLLNFKEFNLVNR
jgi:hypothetical protein